MERAFAAVRALVYVPAFVFLWGWLAVRARGLDQRLGLELPSVVQVPGGVLAAAGGLLALSCIVAFVVEGRGTPALFDAPREFVAAGPYRWVRKPMYVGAVCLLAGTALVLRSPSILGLALAAGLLAHAVVVLVEEPSLAGKFGEKYEVYRRATPRWVPRKPREPR